MIKVLSEIKIARHILLPGGMLFALFFALSTNALAGTFKPPSPEEVPSHITVKGKNISLKDLRSPLHGTPDQIEEYLNEGGEVYFRHCFLCHGDLMDGDGLYGDSFNPRPANFQVKSSILGRPVSYAYWRIMKGGPGLPTSYGRAHSAMPAWEDVLSEEEVWKVILFIYDRAYNPGTLNPPESPSAERGKEVYEQKCVFCHGKDGKGDGVSAAFSSPRPRNLTKGHYKLRSTPFGKLPTEQDLYQMLVRGMPGTTMPSWRHLPKVDLLSLVEYLKVLAPKFEKYKKRGRTVTPIPIPEPQPFTLESVERGRQAYLQNCSGCHGVKGRGDGESTKKVVDIASDAIRPRNLSKPWTFRRGFSRKDIFQTLRTGLSTTAMPRFSDRVHPDEKIWDLVNYVQTLSPPIKPAIPNVMTVEKREGELPLAPDAPLWKEIKTNFFPLAGQIIEGEKAPFVTVDNVWVQAVHNGDEIAFRIRWDDPTFDPALMEKMKIEPSPAPPLPPHLRVAEEDLEPAPKPVPEKIPDAFALQFPQKSGALSYFLGGNKESPVNLWKWNSSTNDVMTLRSEGLSSQKQIANSQSIESSGSFQFGQYTLVMKRKLAGSAAEEFSFEIGKQIPIAFYAWDGRENEVWKRGAVSSWYNLELE